MRCPPLAASALLALLAACGSQPVRDDRPLAISIVGTIPRVAPDPDRTPLSPAERALTAATAQGLVRFDGVGQIEPGLAVRWDVSDDGLFYTFRLRGRDGIDAAIAARRLRAAIAAGSRNPLRPILLAIDEIVAVTPEVLELRLAAPRPNLLQLLAQPELAIRGPRGGGGPMRLVAHTGSGARLVPLVEADAPLPAVADEIRLRSERAALALARFAAGHARVVTGGNFADLPVARVAAAGGRTLRFDLAAGLFGFEIVRADGFLAAPEHRRALAMAIDRDRIVAAAGADGWRAALALVPPSTELATPATPDWTALPLAARVARGRAALAGEAPPVLRVAIPAGPGARALFALVAIDWRAIGVRAIAVGPDEAADLRLVDQVAPGDVATWYLRRFACARAAVCSTAADIALEAARRTPSIPERLRLLREADDALETVVPFIPIAGPLRWSMVAADVPGWHDNPRAVHPLYTLVPGD